MKYLLSILSGILLLTACNTHFITDETYRQTVLEDLCARNEIMAAAGIDLDAMGLTIFLNITVCPGRPWMRCLGAGAFLNVR